MIDALVRRAAASSLVLFVSSTCLTGQELFVYAGREYVPPRFDDARWVRFGDLNADAHLDCVIGLDEEFARVLVGDGTGRFAVRDTVPIRANPSSFYAAGGALGDVDGDGDTDLFVQAFDFNQPTLDLYLNDGTGRMSRSAATFRTGLLARRLSLVVADLDGDGDLDLARGGRSIDLFFNDGSGSFTLGVSVNTNAERVHVADLDGDGDDDVYAGNRQSPQWLENRGGGTFAASPFPVAAPSDVLAIDDLDGDGDVDVVAEESSAIQVYLGDGAGGYTAVGARGVTDRVSPVHLVDFDADGDLDVSTRAAVFLNDGQATFTRDSNVDPSGGRPFGSERGRAFGDVDADGFDDVINAYVPVQLGFNVAAGPPGRRTFVHARNPENPTIPRLSLDVDGDGLDDLIGSLGVRPNDGFGFFGAAVPLPSVPGSLSFHEIDVEPDGDADVVVTVTASPAVLLRNDGTGQFTVERPSAFANLRIGVLVADLDGDGDEDVVHATSPIRWIENRASGFVTGGVFPPSSPATILLAGDVDGDQDLDVFAHGRPGSALFLNDGTGAFTRAPGSAWPSFSSTSIWDAELADLDGDGDLDQVIGTSSAAFSGPRILINNGSGVFRDLTASRFPAGIDSIRFSPLGDYDGDGDVDVLVPTSTGCVLVVNDGNARFTRAPDALVATITNCLGDLAADFDGDGDLDDVVVRSTVRQLQAPVLPRLGANYDVVLHDRSPGQRIGGWWLAARPLATPAVLPGFGRLVVDPIGSIVAPPFVLAPGAVLATTTFRVPATPSLLGGVFYAQGLVAEAGGALRLTNPLRDTIVR